MACMNMCGSFFKLLFSVEEICGVVADCRCEDKFVFFGLCQCGPQSVQRQISRPDESRAVHVVRPEESSS